MKKEHNSTYKNIFKSTFLFSSVKVVQILLGIIRNKAIAILLGADGIGTIGIFANAANLLKTGVGLGISQSAVRDISEANGSGDSKQISYIVSITQKVLLVTSLLGVLITIMLSPYLSKWNFGNSQQTLAYIWLGFAVGLNIVAEGQFGILKGMRQLKALAKASIYGSLFGLLTSLPMYFYYGKAGIVPSLIVSALTTVSFSTYYVGKSQIGKMLLTYREVYQGASPMVKMGVALMLVEFLSLAFQLIIASYVRSHGSMELVGYYRAGTTIITSYFGIVITAMVTDYYPRISAVHYDNIQLTAEVNKQSEVGLLLIFPIAVIFVFLSPLILKLLYSGEFIQAIAFTDFAILGTIIMICSNSLGMILLAKQASKIFIVSVFSQRAILLIVYIVLFNLYGLLGLGISYLIAALLHILLMTAIMQFKYQIGLGRNIFKHLVIVLTVTSVSVLLRNIESNQIKYLSGITLIALSLYYAYYHANKVLDGVIMQKLNSWKRRG